MGLIELPYAATNLKVTIPDLWLGQVVHPRPVEPARDATALVETALDSPIGTPALSRLASPGQRVAVIVDDYTRPTPVHLFLPVILDRLETAGVARDHICIVVALGTHRPMTEAEVAAKVGAQIAADYEIVNVASTTATEMIYLGTSSGGIPAWVNRAVAEADLRIGLGMITPHMDTGFSGGAKIILPGVCSSLTVDAFHAAGAFIPGNQLGNARSPLRLSLEQFVSERVPLDFVANVIITMEGGLYRCVAGHPVEAHRAGVAHAERVFGTHVGHRYPVVVANCHPYDIDLWQSFKGATCGDLITADGGTLILVTAAPEGNSTYPLVPHYAGLDPAGLKRDIETGKAKDKKQAVAGLLIGRLKRRTRLVLVSAGLTPADAAQMEIAYHESVDEAVTEAVERLPRSDREGSVAVVRWAGMVLPLVGRSDDTGALQPDLAKD